MLDVERGVDVDPRAEQLLDVLPALGVARAGRVGVRELVDQDEIGIAGQGGVQVELLELGAAVLHRAARQGLETFEQAAGLGAAVGLDHAHHHVLPGGEPLARLDQHGEGLPHPGGRAEEHLELGAALALLLGAQALEQLFGVGSLLLHRAPRSLFQAGRVASRPMTHDRR